VALEDEAGFTLHDLLPAAIEGDDGWLRRCVGGIFRASCKLNGAVHLVDKFRPDSLPGAKTLRPLV